MATVIDLGENLSYDKACKKLLELPTQNIQENSYVSFILNSLPRILGKTYSTNELSGTEISFTFPRYYFDTSDLKTEQVCIMEGLSREVKLMADIKLVIKTKMSGEDSNNKVNIVEELFTIHLTSFPVISSNKSFIVNGHKRDLILHAEKAPYLRLLDPKDHIHQIFYNLIGKKFVRVSKNLKTNEIQIVLNTSTNSSGFSTFYIPIKDLLNTYGNGNNIKISKLINRDLDLERLFSYSDKKTDSSNLDTIKKIYQLDISVNERLVLNKKLSFKENLINKTLSEKTGHLEARTKLTSKDLDLLQNLGYEYLEIQKDGKTYYQFNNGFVDPMEYIFNPDSLIDLNYKVALGLDVYKTYSEKEKKEFMHKWFGEKFRYYDTNIYDLTQTVSNSWSYYKVSKVILDRLLEECLRDNRTDINSIFNANIERLIGTYMNEIDLIAMVNDYSLIKNGYKEVDDLDSTANKSLANVQEIFESILTHIITGTPLVSGRDQQGQKRTANYALTNVLQKTMLVINQAVGKGSTEPFYLDKLNCTPETTLTRFLLKEPFDKLFNSESSINSFAKMNSKRKITIKQVMGRGGISGKATSAKPRDVHISQIGRVDLIETPEGANVGLDNYLTEVARVNQFGIIEAPYFKIDKENKRILTDKLYYMDYNEECRYTRTLPAKIANKDSARITVIRNGVEIEDLEIDLIVSKSKGREILNKADIEILSNRYKDEYPDCIVRTAIGLKDWFTTEKVTAYKNKADLVEIPGEEVDFILASPHAIYSVVTGSIPFANYDDGTRLAMGGSMTKQTQSVIGSDVPLVRTDLSDKVGVESGDVILAPFNCIVKHVDATKIIIQKLDKAPDNSLEFFGDNNVKNIDFDTDVNEQDLYTIYLTTLDKTSAKTLMYQKPAVNHGDFVMKGEILVDSINTKDGKMAMGSNLLVAYIPYAGYNFEDAIVISNRLFEEDILTSYLTEKYEMELARDSIKPNILDHLSEKMVKKYNLDKNGMVKVGTRVRKNDTLLAIPVISDNSAVKDKIQPLHYNEEDLGVIVKTDIVDDPNTDIVKYIIYTSTREKIKTGDKLSGRHGNKGIISPKIVPHHQMPMLKDGTHIDIILTLLGIPSRMNTGQLIEASLGLLLKENNLRAVTKAGRMINIQKLKRIINSYVGSEDGKLQLYDPMTGKPFLYKSLVGYSTIYKLEHIASHKIFSRGRPSSVKTNLYTQKGQPTQGKSRGGGQKIGEMESWSLISLGAKNVAQELYIINSDDKVNREKAIKERDTYTEQGNYSAPLTFDIEPNTSDAFKNLSQHLTALGLKQTFETNNKELDLFLNNIKSNLKYENTIKTFLFKQSSSNLKKDENVALKDCYNPKMKFTSDLISAANYIERNLLLSLNLSVETNLLKYIESLENSSSEMATFSKTKLKPALQKLFPTNKYIQKNLIPDGVNLKYSPLAQLLKNTDKARMDSVEDTGFSSLQRVSGLGVDELDLGNVLDLDLSDSILGIDLETNSNKDTQKELTKDIIDTIKTVTDISYLEDFDIIPIDEETSNNLGEWSDTGISEEEEYEQEIDSDNIFYKEEEDIIEGEDFTYDDTEEGF